MPNRSLRPKRCRGRNGQERISTRAWGPPPLPNALAPLALCPREEFRLSRSRRASHGRVYALGSDQFTHSVSDPAATYKTRALDRIAAPAAEGSVQVRIVWPP